MLQKWNIFRFFKPFTRKALKSVDFVGTIRKVSTKADFESLLKVREVDITVKSIVV